LIGAREDLRGEELLIDGDCSCLMGTEEDLRGKLLIDDGGDRFIPEDMGAKSAVRGKVH
jgi:hypothetical protein